MFLGGGGCLCVDRSNSPAQCVSTAGRALEETHTLTKCLPIEPDDKIIIEEREEETEGRERERGGERGGRERGGERVSLYLCLRIYKSFHRYCIDLS